VDFILNKKLKFYTKEILKFFSIITIALELICAIMLIKYKPAYAISLSNQEIGYVENKKEFEEIISQEVLNSEDINVDNISLNDEVSYELKLVNKNKDTNEEQIISVLKDNTTTTYKYYTIAINNENVVSLNSIEEAKQILNNLKESNIDTLKLNIQILENYTINKEELKTETIETAKAQTLDKAKIKVQERKEQERIDSLPEINGIKLAVVPVSGRISSRYGSNNPRIRDHIHAGLDIAARTGTNIKAVADGTVTFASYSGGYGYLVKIDHGNNVETRYAHCSKIHVKQGQKVQAGDIISAVGNTGNSTGPHLHFEVRVNGNSLNPEKYLYN